MVQMGERIRHDLKLATLAHWVIVNARADSADRGAAICVLGYQVLAKREIKMAPKIAAFIADYLRVTADEHANRHVLRWRLSLTFLAGRLCELMGDRKNAANWYHAVAGCKWRDFSPVLATKAVAACFFEGRIRLADGEIEQAKSCFAQGLAEALAAVKGDLNDIVGNPEQHSFRPDRTRGSDRYGIAVRQRGRSFGVMETRPRAVLETCGHQAFRPGVLGVGAGTRKSKAPQRALWPSAARGLRKGYPNKGGRVKP